MKHITKSFRLVASAFYRIAYKLHHKLFLRPQPQLRVPVFIVGSYLAGGAGKTPFTIWLAKHFQEQGKKIAILCHSAAWDEFIMIEREFQSAKSTQIKVFATKNRYKTAKEIQDKFDIILCDDGFEDSRFTGAHRICLDWQEPPQSIASLLPSGPFRSLKQDHDESEIIHIDCVGNNGHCVNSPAINFSIESITNLAPQTQLNATIVCGLGAPKRFIEDVHAFTKTHQNAACLRIEKVIIRPDHDKHFQQIVQAELAQDKDIVISQKDACRLQQSLLAHPKLHTAIQKITVSDNILKKIALAVNF